MGDCKKCGYCCTHFQLNFTTEQMTALEKLHTKIWLELHKNVEVTSKQGGFTVKINEPCEHLDPVTHLCKEYDKRPIICRKGQCLGEGKGSVYRGGARDE